MTEESGSEGFAFPAKMDCPNCEEHVSFPDTVRKSRSNPCPKCGFVIRVGGRSGGGAGILSEMFVSNLGPLVLVVIGFVVAYFSLQTISTTSERLVPQLARQDAPPATGSPVDAAASPGVSDFPKMPLLTEVKGLTIREALDKFTRDDRISVELPENVDQDREIQVPSEGHPAEAFFQEFARTLAGPGMKVDVTFLVRGAARVVVIGWRD